MNKPTKRGGQPARKHRSNSESDKTLLKIPSIDESGDESIEEYDDGSGPFDIVEKQRISTIVPSSSSHMMKSTIATTPTGAIGVAAVAIIHDEIDPIEEEDDVDIESIDDDTLIVEQQLKQQQQSLRPRSTVDDRQPAQISGVDSADRDEPKLKISGESSLVSKCKKLSLKTKKGKKQQSSAAPAATLSSDTTTPASGTATVTSTTPSATAATSATTTTSTSASSSSKSNSNKIGYNNLIASLLRTTTL